MAIFEPFQALRPRAETVAEISCPPYDVVTVEQAREFVKDKPLNLLHATLPEVDGDADLDTLVARGASFLSALSQNMDEMARDSEAAFYAYEQTWAGRTRTGFFGCVSVDDYAEGNIVRHELTRPDKVEERTRHIVGQKAHAEPVMLVYRNSPPLTGLLRSNLIDAIPLADFTDEADVRHRLFRLDPRENGAVAEAFAPLRLYIADGHHRCHSAWQAAERLDPGRSQPDAGFRRFPAVLLPDSEVQILPYNRVITSAPGGWLRNLSQTFALEPVAGGNPDGPGDVRLGTRDGWFRFRLPEPDPADIVTRIDAERLQRHVLTPLFHIDDIRTNPNIRFSGGPGSVPSMRAMLDRGEAEAAFSLWPVSIADLLTVSDAGLLMPPKSTWFEPKLRTGLLLHTF